MPHYDRMKPSGWYFGLYETVNHCPESLDCWCAAWVAGVAVATISITVRPNGIGIGTGQLQLQLGALWFRGNRTTREVASSLIAHRAQKSRGAEVQKLPVAIGGQAKVSARRLITRLPCREYIFSSSTLLPPPLVSVSFFFYCSRLSSLMPELELSFSLDIDWVAMRLMCCDINLVFGVAKRAMHCDSQKFSR